MTIVTLPTGCGGASQPDPIHGSGSILTDNYANKDLHYYYYIPRSVADNGAQPWPCLVMVPPLSGRGEAFVSQQFKDFADAEGFVIVAPSFVWDEANWESEQSYQYPWSWSGDALTEILDQFEAANGIDVSKLYFFGFSAGAQFSLRFCVWKPELCAACAAHGSGGWVIPTVATDVSFLVTVGSQDGEDRRANARGFCAAAQDLGINAECREYPVGHGLSEAQKEDSIEFFRRVASGS